MKMARALVVGTFVLGLPAISMASDQALEARAHLVLGKNNTDQMIPKLSAAEKAAFARALSWVQLKKEKNPQLLNPSSKKVYLACNPKGLQLLAGFIAGECVVLGVNPGGKIEVLPASIKQGRLGVGGMFSFGSISSGELNGHDVVSATLELKGVQDLRDVAGWHVGGSLATCLISDIVIAQSSLNGKVTATMDPQASTSFGCNLSGHISKLKTAEKPFSFTFKTSGDQKAQSEPAITQNNAKVLADSVRGASEKAIAISPAR